VADRVTKCDPRCRQYCSEEVFVVRATRRTVLKGAAAVTAASGVQLFPARSAHAGPGPVRPEGTTLEATILAGGDVVAEGEVAPYRRLTRGPGEPHTVREELGATAQRGRAERRAPVLSFAHLTDIHVIDAQSPARVEFLDRYDDDADTATLFASAYRPQEFLSPHIADAVIAAVRRVGVGPVMGQGLAFGISTGDGTDNAQLNELHWQIDLLNGTPFRPNSGGPTFEGVHDQDALTYDVHYWHPDGTPDGQLDDHARRLFGFPTVAGLLDVAIAPLAPSGVGMPWYSCYGNHDGLVQGNFPATFQLERIAVGPLKVVRAPTGLSQDDLRRGDATALQNAFAGPARTVTADSDRRILSRRQTVEEHFTRGGAPMGHGFTMQNLADGTAYYVIDDVSPMVRGIVLDSVNPNGDSRGSLDQAQFAWLRARLEEVTGPGRDRLVVVFSHHTIGTMTNRFPVGSDDPSHFGQRVLGEQVKALLLEFPNVVLLVNGHTHVNRVTPHTRPDGGGFWEVNTAAHIDFPCQARLLEIADNRDGTLSVFATVVDADAPLVAAHTVGSGTSTAQLASLGREVAANDAQKRRSDRRGALEDRNVELLVAAPFPLSPVPPVQAPPAQVTEPAVAARSTATLPATGAGAGVAAGALGVAALGAVLRRRMLAEQSD
jgi:metallophosphoesterase (TIGR03767 family)